MAALSLILRIASFGSYAYMFVACTRQVNGDGSGWGPTIAFFFIATALGFFANLAHSKALEKHARWLQDGEP